MTTKIKTGLAILLLLPWLAASGAEKRNFFGTWEPPSSLSEFWRPLDDSWWETGKNQRLGQYAKKFARAHEPESLLPDMVKDLHAHPSVEREFVYILVALNWDTDRVMRILKPYYNGKDPEIRKIASDFIADLEE